MFAALLPATFHTARLHARRMDETHLPLVAAMHADDRLMATMGGTRDLAASRLYLLRNLAHWSEQGYGMYVLSEGEDGAPMGRAGLKRSVARDGVEVAYAFLPRGWGKGYATEIAQALLGAGLRGGCPWTRWRRWRWTSTPRPAGSWKSAACARSRPRARAWPRSAATGFAAPIGWARSRPDAPRLADRR